jgi:hypothetical protein
MKMKPHHKTKLLVALRGHAVRVEEMERVTDYTHSWRKVQNIKGQSARKKGPDARIETQVARRGS